MVSAVRRMTPIIEVASYPVVVALGLAVFWALLHFGLAVAPASYLAVLIGTVLITLHEIALPYRESWKPTTREIGADAMFMLVVQVALP